MTWERLRILHIMECTIGGTRRHIRELTSGLSLRGHDVTAVCSAVRDPTFQNDMESMRQSAVKVIELPMLRAISPRTDFKHFLFLYRLLKQESFDIIHTHSSKAGVLGRFAAMFAGQTSVIHTPHTFAFAFKGHFSFFKRQLFLEIERFLGRTTSHLVDVSNSERVEALGYRIIPSDRIGVIENGIDPWPLRWSEPPDPGEGVFKDRNFSPCLGAVGLLNAAKGHDVLLDAFVKIRKVFPNAGLAIIGQGELAGKLKSQISELGLEDCAFLAGYRNDVPSALKDFDLFVFPSLWEGMPAGVPAVVTDVNGSRDIVINEECGLICPPGDVDALASACMKMLSDKNMMANMAQEGIRRVMKYYTLDKMLDKMENLYFETVTEKRGTP